MKVVGEDGRMEGEGREERCERGNVTVKNRDGRRAEVDTNAEEVRARVRRSEGGERPR